MANFTTINKPGLHFNTKLYAGNGSARSITGVGFQPDWCWFKNRDTTNGHSLFDAVRGATKNLISNSNAAESTSSNGLTAFASDGFSVGTDGDVNGNGNNIVSWNWKAAGGSGSSNTDGSINTISTSVNTTAGFSICKWTGTGSAGTIGHGLSAVPKMIICKNTDTTVNWIVYHNGLDASAPQNKYIELNATTALQDYPMWNDTAPTSSVFSVGSDIATNKSGSPMIAYCFAEKRGYSKFGSYIGNGNANGSFVHTGFKPAWLLVKRAVGGTQDWQQFDNKINPHNVATLCMRPNQNNGEQTGNAMDLLSNGFKNRLSGSSVNTAGDTYIYMAFAEEPLVGTNKVCSTAR
jgi:hypothetical protein